MYRQGDVLIIPIKSGARGKDIREAGRVILAHGEATGHAHEVVSDEPDSLTFEEISDDVDTLRGARLLRVTGTGKAVVRHQEHSPIELPAGTYRVIRQREYFPQAIRNVAD